MPWPREGGGRVDIIAHVMRRALKKITDDTEVDFEAEFNKISPIKAVKMDEAFEVETLEGTMKGKAGDWLAEGAEGERWPIDADIFEKTYEKAKTAALVQTNSAVVYAIAPEQLQRIIVEGQWAMLAGQVAGAPSAAMNKIVRLHGGAVFTTNHRGVWDVSMPDARFEYGYLRTTGSPKVAGTIALTDETVEQFRKDFLLLLKNIGREFSAADLIRWRDAVIKWRERFRLFGTQIRADLQSRGRDSGWTEHYLKAMTPFWDFIAALQDTPVASLDYLVKYDQRSNGDSFTPAQYQERAERSLQQMWATKGPEWGARAKRKAPAAWKYLKELIAWTLRDGYFGGGGQPVALTEPTVENLTLEGFRVQFHGFVESDAKTQTYLVSLKEGLRKYRERAGKVFPWLIQYQLPLVAHWSGGDGESSATYERNHIAVYFYGLASKPDRLVHLLSHEMGHHIYQNLLGGSDKKAWDQFIGGDYKELDLREVLAKMKPGETVFEFGERIEREDPILHIQIESLHHNRTYSGLGIWGVTGVKKHLDAGKDPMVHVPASPITGYASKNTEEAFCEALGKLVAYGPRSVPDSVAWMMRQILPNMRLGSMIQRVASRFLEAKDRPVGTSVGLFLPLPAELAGQFPSLGENDTSPPHVTLLYVGEVTKDREKEFLRVVREVLANEPGPVRAWLNGVDKFVHSEQAREVFYVPVRFSRDMGMVRDRLAAELQTAGFEIKNRFPLAYSPHVTLGYFDGFDNPTPTAPEGAWEFDSAQVWGLAKKYDIDLGTFGDMSVSRVAGRAGANG